MISHQYSEVIKQMQSLARQGTAFVFDYFTDSTPVNSPRFGKPENPRDSARNFEICKWQRNKGRFPFFVSPQEIESALPVWRQAIEEKIKGDISAIRRGAEIIAKMFVAVANKHIESGEGQKGNIRPIQQPKRAEMICKDGRNRSVYVGGWYAVKKQARYGETPVLVASGQLKESHKAGVIVN